MEFGLTPDDIKCINDALAKVTGIDKVIIFGSRALGTNKKGSDIDLALVGNSLTFDSLLEAYSRLEELGLLYKFDLQLFNKIKDPNVLDHINRVGQVLCP